MAAPPTGTVVWSEDFQTQDFSPTNAPTSLDGFGYSAGHTWQAGDGNCNGWVLNFNSASPGDGCDGGGGLDATGIARTDLWYAARLTTVLGSMQGMTGAIPATNSPTKNSAVVDLTNGGTNSQAAGIQFEASGVASAAAGHYYEVAANFSAIHCPGDPSSTSAWTAPSETVFLVVDGVPQPVAGDGTLAGGINLCTDPQSTLLQPTNATTGVTDWGGMVFHNLYLVSGPVLVTTNASLGLQVFNAQASPVGNDMAFDNLQIIDVTNVIVPPAPSLTLSQEALPSTVTSVADVVQYRFTITNTGNVAISSIGVYQAPASAGRTGTGTMTAVTCPQTTLAAGESTVCTASYSPSRADIDAGQWANAALAIGLATGASAPTLSGMSTVQVSVAGGGQGGGGSQGGGGGGSQGGGGGGQGGGGGSSGGQSGTGGSSGQGGSGQGGSSGQSGYSISVDTGGVLSNTDLIPLLRRGGGGAAGVVLLVLAGTRRRPRLDSNPWQTMLRRGLGAPRGLSVWAS